MRSATGEWLHWPTLRPADRILFSLKADDALKSKDFLSPSKWWASWITKHNAPLLQTACFKDHKMRSMEDLSIHGRQSSPVLVIFWHLLISKEPRYRSLMISRALSVRLQWAKLRCFRCPKLLKLLIVSSVKLVLERSNLWRWSKSCHPAIAKQTRKTTFGIRVMMSCTPCFLFYEICNNMQMPRTTTEIRQLMAPTAKSWSTAVMESELWWLSKHVYISIHISAYVG